MEIPKLQIGKLTAKFPIIQGGMGVKVSLASLASAVANEGGIGTIAAVGLGDLSARGKEFERKSREALMKEIEKARKMTSGLLALNVMGALSNADELVKSAVKSGIDIIVFGAGLPLRLPALVEDSDVALVPIISSSRVANLILRAWDKRYKRTVDGFILEGPLAGGHLGFTPEQLEDPENYSLEKLLPQVLDTVAPYEEKFGKKIPVIVAGGIYTGEDMADMLALGASGVQLGTRFVCTEECGVSKEFKQAYVDAEKEDISIIKSPVGMPGRALRNPFVKVLDGDGRHKYKCNYRCLASCEIDKAKFCIADALLKSYSGDVDNGLIFCGANAHRIDKITTVQALFSELLTEFRGVGGTLKQKVAESAKRRLAQGKRLLESNES
jgi:nitronate monooxygenase